MTRGTLSEKSYAMGRSSFTAVETLAPGGMIGKTTKVSKFTVAYRQERMLEKNVGYNITPENWFQKHPTIGQEGTYITDYRAIAEILGPYKADTRYNVGLFSRGNTISYSKTAELEYVLGLRPGSLIKGFRFTRITNIADKHPASPIKGNDFFKGPGKGLPNGGPELIIDPVPTQPWPLGK